MKDTERCRKCRYKYDDRVCRFCLDFNKYNPMTNSMKIRSMSDEELAEFLQRNSKCKTCSWSSGIFCYSDEHDCDGGVLDWLKSEAKE